MEKLIFTCPATGREVDAGFAADIGTLLRLRRYPLRARCPACGRTHLWLVADGQLARAA